ncbi:hypothetical protein KI387_042286, partial [Taxus chinensis]
MTNRCGEAKDTKGFRLKMNAGNIKGFCLNARVIKGFSLNGRDADGKGSSLIRSMIKGFSLNARLIKGFSLNERDADEKGSSLIRSRIKGFDFSYRAEGESDKYDSRVRLKIVWDLDSANVPHGVPARNIVYHIEQEYLPMHGLNQPISRFEASGKSGMIPKPVQDDLFSCGVSVGNCDDDESFKYSFVLLCIFLRRNRDFPALVICANR